MSDNLQKLEARLHSRDEEEKQQLIQEKDRLETEWLRVKEFFFIKKMFLSIKKLTFLSVSVSLFLPFSCSHYRFVVKFSMLTGSKNNRRTKSFVRKCNESTSK